MADSVRGDNVSRTCPHNATAYVAQSFQFCSLHHWQICVIQLPPLTLLAAAANCCCAMTSADIRPDAVSSPPNAQTLIPAQPFSELPNCVVAKVGRGKVDKHHHNMFLGYNVFRG